MVKLLYGLVGAVPADKTTGYGARWIFPDDVLWDRQSLVGEDEAKLATWLNDGAYNKARDAARRLASNFTITQNSEATVTLYEDKTGIVVGNPRRSFGYLYVAAWLK